MAASELIKATRHTSESAVRRDSVDVVGLIMNHLRSEVEAYASLNHLDYDPTRILWTISAAVVGIPDDEPDRG